jgi:hypothetical protein
VVDERLLFFHVNSPLAHGDAVLLAGRWKYFFNRRTQVGTLHDIEVDPGETRDIAAEHLSLTIGLNEVLQRWRGQQLAYYHYPAYFQSFFPPRAPVWERDDPDSDSDGSVVMSPQNATVPRLKNVRIMRWVYQNSRMKTGRLHMMLFKLIPKLIPMVYMRGMHMTRVQLYYWNLQRITLHRKIMLMR